MEVRVVSDTEALAALRVLLQSSHLAGPDSLPTLVTGAGARIGSDAVVLYVVDYDQTLLVPLEAPSPAAGESASPMAVDGTLAGRAFTDVSQQLSTDPAGSLVWTPVLNGTERLGVICHHFP